MVYFIQFVRYSLLALSAHLHPMFPVYNIYATQITYVLLFPSVHHALTWRCSKAVFWDSPALLAWRLLLNHSGFSDSDPVSLDDRRYSHGEDGFVIDAHLTVTATAVMARDAGVSRDRAP